MFREHQPSFTSILSENEIKTCIYFCEMELVKYLLLVWKVKLSVWVSLVRSNQGVFTLDLRYHHVWSFGKTDASLKCSAFETKHFNKDGSYAAWSCYIFLCQFIKIVCKGQIKFKAIYNVLIIYHMMLTTYEWYTV